MHTDLLALARRRRYRCTSAARSCKGPQVEPEDSRTLLPGCSALLRPRRTTHTETLSSSVAGKADQGRARARKMLPGRSGWTVARSWCWRLEGPMSAQRRLSTSRARGGRGLLRPETHFSFSACLFPISRGWFFCLLTPSITIKTIDISFQFPHISVTQ